MPETTNYKFPFPDDEDAPDGPTQIGDLANDLDAVKWLSRSLKPTIGVKKSSASVSPLTTSYQDIPGMSLTITPAVSSLLLVTLQVRLGVQTAENAQATLKVDSESELTDVAFVGLGATGGSISTSASQVYAISLTAAEHTIKARAKASGSFMELVNGTMLYQLFAA